MQRVQPVNIQGLVEAVGVTATAVRHRLSHLQSLGLIDRVTVPQQRGRPSHEYRLTAAGVRLLGDETSELAVLLWREIQSIEDPEVRQRLLGRVKADLVRRLGSFVSSASISDRVQNLCHSLEDRGLMVESELTGALPLIREHSCPYHAVAQSDAAICEMEQEAFAEVLGAPVELSACRLNGHRCCEFQVGVPS